MGEIMKGGKVMYEVEFRILPDGMPDTMLVHAESIEDACLKAVRLQAYAGNYNVETKGARAVYDH
jgi:hypothetical protein